jgi:Ca2+-binding RTX toxin-like protein
LTGIERIDGTERGDTFKGNAAANYFSGGFGADTLDGRDGNDVLQGDQGADILTGGAGFDEFHYEGPDPWGDTITDFVSGIDHFAFRVSNFAGMDGTVRFVNGAAALGAGSWFYFNAANHTLFWDFNGTGAGGAVAVATLTGVNVMAAGDIQLIV